MVTTYLQDLLRDDEFRRTYRQERLLGDVLEVIASAMEQRGVSGAELARRLGVSRQAVSALLSGRANVSVRRVAEVLDGLDCEMKVSLHLATGNRQMLQWQQQESRATLYHFDGTACGRCPADRTDEVPDPEHRTGRLKGSEAKMPFCMEVDREALEQAERIARSVELERVDVVRMSAERRDGGGPPPAKLRLQLQHEARHVPSDDRAAIIVIADFGLEALEAESEAAVASAELSLCLRYQAVGNQDQEPGEAAVASFAEINGVYNAWPYWREYLHSTLGRLGLPGVLTPVLQILPTSGKVAGRAQSREES